MKAKKVLAAGVLCAMAIGLAACGGGSAVPGSPQDKRRKPKEPKPLCCTLPCRKTS